MFLLAQVEDVCEFNKDMLLINTEKMRKMWKLEVMVVKVRRFVWVAYGQGQRTRKMGLLRLGEHTMVTMTTLTGLDRDNRREGGRGTIEEMVVIEGVREGGDGEY